MKPHVPIPSRTSCRWTSCLLWLVAALHLAVPLPAPGQEGPVATTVTNPVVSTSLLRSQLRPIPKDELKVELDAWLALLRSKAEEIRDVEIALDGAQGDDLHALGKQLITLQAERARLVEQVYTVMNAYAAKGGDVETADKYVRSVWTIERPGRKDLWPVLQAWLTSADGGGRAMKNLLQFLLWVGVTLVAARLVGKAVFQAVARIPRVSRLLGSFLTHAARTAVYVTGAVIALSHLGVNAAPLAAALGTTGFIVGFALKDTLSNYASGVMILIYRPYDVGDTVSAAGVSGVIEAMNLVSTVFRTEDDQKVIVPNTKIWSGTITNASKKASE